MKNRIIFYLFIVALGILDAVLLRSPNLLGKIGLLIYNYDYLRTFPKALLTVSLVIGTGVVIAETIRYRVQRKKLTLSMGRFMLFLLCTASIAILVKTIIDFTAWSYSHTGLRFQWGAFLLPSILTLLFLYAWISLPKPSSTFPVSPITEENTKNESHAIH